jgi:hypothetical protein
MNTPCHLSLNGSSRTCGEIPVVLKEALRGGLSLLWRGFEYARDLDAKTWEFAVDCNALYQAGMSAIDLRWLIARGYIQSAPNSVPSGGQAPFADKRLSFESHKVSFILTNLGVELASEVLSPKVKSHLPIPSERAMISPAAGCTTVAPSLAKPTPTWDRDRKELRCGESVIKRFRWAAVNQETILMAYEEEGWPIRIDDPLPQKLNHDPKSRLHDTIKCLNRNHEKRLIHFSGDGTGEGVLWRFL